MYGYGYKFNTSIFNRGVAYDTDAQAFFTATGITDLTQKSAVNQLVLDLKSYSIWSKIVALYPFVGGDSTKHSGNLKNPSLYQLTFSSGWTHSSTGSLPNGTNAYASTGIKVSDFTISSIGISVYLRTDTAGLYCDIGTVDEGRFQLLSKLGSSIYCAFPGANVLDNGATPNSLGLFSINRYSSSNRKIYKNGALHYTATETMISTPSNYDFKIGASGGASVTWYSPRQNALACFKNAFTDTDELNFNTAVTTFQTSLGRNV